MASGKKSAFCLLLTIRMMPSSKQGRGQERTLLQFMEKEENRRPQHFLFSFEMKGESERQRETKKEPYLDTLDALILCDLL